MPCLSQEAPFCLTTPRGRLSGWQLDRGGPSLGVFVHGFRSDCNGTKSLALAAQAVVRGYDWLRFDLSGHGSSEGDFRAFRLSTMLADLEAVLAWCGRPVMLVGSSMGGWLSVLAALRHTEQVRALVLIAPAFDFIPLYFESLPAAEREDWRRDRWRRFASAYGEDYELDYSVLADAAPFGLLSRPQTLTCPVTIVHGERDEAVPPEVSGRFFSQLDAPAKALHVIPGGDHRLSAGIPFMCEAVARSWPA